MKKYVSLYNYISENYLSISREEFAVILKELLYQFSSSRGISKRDFIEAIKETIEEVNEDFRMNEKINLDFENYSY
jgi:hypothetical protein